MAEQSLGIVAPVAKGVWDNNTTYNQLNIVQYDNGSYISLKNNNTGYEPKKTAGWTNYWQPLSVGLISKGTWNNSTTYSLNNYVEYDGVIYISLQDNNLAIEPTVTTGWTNYWQKFIKMTAFYKHSLMFQYTSVITWTIVAYSTNVSAISTIAEAVNVLSVGMFASGKRGSVILYGAISSIGANSIVVTYYDGADGSTKTVQLAVSDSFSDTVTEV